MTQQKKEFKPLVKICCPYFDIDKQSCSHPSCIRMPGCECKYSNRRKQK